MYRIEILQTAGGCRGFYSPGSIASLPRPGYRVTVLDKEGLVVVRTSEVAEIEKQATDLIFFKTINSAYLLKVFDYIDIRLPCEIRTA